MTQLSSPHGYYALLLPKKKENGNKKRDKKGKKIKRNSVKDLFRRNSPSTNDSDGMYITIGK